MAKKPATTATAPKSGISALAGLASKTAKTATAKKDDKKIHKLDKDLSKELQDYVEASREMDTAEARKKAAEAVLKAKGKEIFISEVEKLGIAPDSFIMSSEDSKYAVLSTTMDKYIYSDLDEARVDYLRTKFGVEVIEEENKFEINAELIDEHGEELVRLIQSSPKFSKEVKENLIQLKQKFFIKKGSINKLKTLADNATKNCGTPCPVAEVYEEIKPIATLKPRGK